MNDFITVVLPIVSGIAMALVVYLWMRIRTGGEASSYDIAVVGYPQSGKTMMITAAFGELFTASIKGITIMPRGKATIEKVNEDLARLEMGKALGPTKDQDLFSYKAEFTFKVGLFSRKYNVKIGDFPGEDSQEFAETFGDWFHETPYFSWVMEAQAFIFVVDIAEIIIHWNDNDYVAKISKGFRAAWQHIREHHMLSKRSIMSKRVLLVFTKTDLLFRTTPLDHNEAGGEGEDAKMISKLGFGVDLPKPISLHYDEIFTEKNVFRESIEEKFAELIEFFKSQSKRFHVIYVSALAYDEHGRYGIRDLLSGILP